MILTASEYEELKKKTPQVVKKPAEISHKEIKEEEYVYMLYSPEHDMENFHRDLMLNEKKFYMDCENGIVKTDSEWLANDLQNKGYQMLRKEVKK